MGLHPGTPAGERLTATTRLSIIARVDSRTIIRKLRAHGWELWRITGSHHHFKHPTTPVVVTVPHPRKDVPIGTIKSIERQSGIKVR